MALDIDYIAAEQAIEKLKDKLTSIPHGEREKIADEIILSVDIIIKNN